MNPYKMDKLFENKVFFENMKKVIEVSQGRGCWKPNEMKSIGGVWADLEKILTYIEANQTKEVEVESNVEVKEETELE